MWCAECQLDVPTLAVPEEPGTIRCAFCRGELAGRAERGAAPEGTAEKEPQAVGSQQKTPSKQQETGNREQETADREQVPADNRTSAAIEAVPQLLLVPPPTVDDWEGEAELRRAERLLAVLRQTSDASGEPQAAGAPRLFDPEVQAATSQPQVNQIQAPSLGLAAWSCLTLGLMAFVCGGVLLVWSFLGGRGDLWSLGLPLTLAGQVGLVLGLLLQLDGLSQSSRRTEQSLTDLDDQLDELRGVTALVSSTHSAPAHAFYAHMSAGASPQVLLADLKGQLDLLAQQMARQRKAA